MIRIGEINYLNVYPIYYYLKKILKDENRNNFADFISGTPAFLNRKLQSGGVDISPSSSFYYISNYDNSYIFPNLSISSKKKVKSIYLFSNKSIEDFNKNETIYVTPETLTSVNLLKVLLAEFYKMDLNLMKFLSLKQNDNLELEIDSDYYKKIAEGSSFLHIGNNALRLVKSIPDGYHAYDLADLWYRHTSFPFVFALFIIRKESYDANKNEFSVLYDYLIESKRKALSGFKEAAESVIKSGDYNFISFEELMEYWTDCLSFNLGSDEIRGFNIYTELLYKYKLIKSIPDLNFV
jgi:chorismate dehydratase